SQEHVTTCLRAWALMTVISYLGFFSTRFQRVALSTVASICKKLLSDVANFVMEAEENMAEAKKNVTKSYLLKLCDVDVVKI
nr:E3 ubiquitin-protein ligase UPL3-like [Tanacetum cinerariifolium]